MEDSLVGSDAQIGLNIIAKDVKPRTNARSKPKKKNSKFEKRRRKAQQAKAKKVQKKTETASTATDNDSTHSDSKLEEKTKINDTIDTSDNELEQAPVTIDVTWKEEMGSDSEDTGNEQRDDFHTSNATLPQDEVERAKYFAEFHARPLELDRRSGAVLRKVGIGKDSQHLFTESRRWDNLQIHERLIKVIQADHFKLERPTVIQSKTIPVFFQGNQKHNLLIHSETGSGKTLAVLLPILQSLAVGSDGELKRIDRTQSGTRCLILCPTRELAAQTLTVAEKLCSNAFNWLVPGGLFGEEKRKSEKGRIRKGLSIIVATPGRCLDHLTRTESLLMSLKGKIEWIVLDEADRLLDMGLGEQVKQIVQRIRANQPGSGCDGITWRSVLVSATVTPSVEELAKNTLMGGDSHWVWVKGGSDVSNAVVAELAESTPRQLAQLQMTVSAKLRLPALVAFLVQRVKRGERVVVFMSTCASVDYYHALFSAAESILEDNDSNTVESGIFGKQCPIYKLHGNVLYAERQLTLRKFMNVGVEDGKSSRAAILIATDVAARGLNLPDCDWTVQYDPPSEVADYVHRAGRVARAGRAGHSLLFLLPSEEQFLEVLQHRGVKSMAGLSLASTLNQAADICSSFTEEGQKRSGGGIGQTGSTSSRSGEAFCSELQRRLEELVMKQDAEAKAAYKLKSKGMKRKSQKPAEIIGNLLELARNAFVSHIRAYPTKEKQVRHIFSAKALHLGHVARSFALREPPKRMSSRSRVSNHEDEKKKHNNIMTFGDFQDEPYAPVEGAPTKRLKKEASMVGVHVDPKKARVMFLANAAKLQANGLNAL